MGKHKLEVASSSGVKRMMSKTKDIDVKNQIMMLDQIHLLVCMYITMWATNKEEHAWMVEAKLDNFCQLNYNIVDLLAINKIIFGIQVQNVGNILQGKHIYLDFPTINQIFKLPAKGIVVLAQEAYNEEWSEYFEGGKEEHYKYDSWNILAKVRAYGMWMRLITLAEVATFWQGNCCV
jgi:hypothetical protein